MDYIGIDLHKTSSQVCILTEGGELVERRIKTDSAMHAPCARRAAWALIARHTAPPTLSANPCALGRARDAGAHAPKYISLIGALAR
jgi:hypothetical protein